MAAWIRSVVAALALAVPTADAAQAEIRSVPVARVAIYPGDTITAAMIEDRPAPTQRAGTMPQHASREQVIGKVARRTLLPGHGIPLAGVREPDAVRSGKIVTLVFVSGSLVITGRGLAMQAGAVGDAISIQNTDSGVLVRGTVQADGSVRLED